ncbi:tRNA dihydrouridine synthase DusB [Pseudobythopirellula maris]|uniref:tRNA dihydrouridine synthase DusB n=1 Tax=Pseudobythopirellula maris TaxID=2527991 RepID=UPI0021BC7C65|nr:tRNA dihydrouridine synthase DusB [Pseudobythopirellula maris]
MTTLSTNAPAGRPQIAPLVIGDLVVDPPILQAPMAGFTNYAFRQIVREFGGSGLLATEMVNAKGFVWLDEQEAEHPDRLWGVADEPRPLAVQIWDNDPETLAKVGRRLVEDYRVSVVDINFGCPVRQVTEKAHSGSYLLREPDRMGRIIERVVEACAPTPVTAKTRLGCTRDKIVIHDVAQIVEGAGAAALTVHGRTAADMFRGSADWETIASIKPHLKRIPLIGNGDLDTPEKVLEAFTHFGVDGVMIARASLGKPWLFAQAAALLRGEPAPLEPSLDEQRRLMVRHFGLVVDRFGEQKGSVLMRKYACCYAQGRRGAREFRKHVATIRSSEEFFAVVERWFPSDELPSTGRQPTGSGSSCTA